MQLFTATLVKYRCKFLTILLQEKLALIISVPSSEIEAKHSPQRQNNRDVNRVLENFSAQLQLRVIQKVGSPASATNRVGVLHLMMGFAKQI